MAEAKVKRETKLRMKISLILIFYAKLFIPPVWFNSSLNLFLDVNYKTGRFQISKIHVLR